MTRRRRPFKHKRIDHGLSNTPEYAIWRGMRMRCYNKNNDDYANYGGKGIRVCDRWHLGEAGIHPFVCFLSDLGRRPSTKHSLDRFPNEEGHYEPSNVRWANPKEQAWNKVGKPRPDLAARNRANAGQPRKERPKHVRLKISRAMKLAHQRKPNWSNN